MLIQHSNILFLVNARPTFMASSVLPTLSSHVNFTSQYIDLTDSLAGSDFRVTKPGVYLIFWNVIATNMVHATLLVNGKGAGKAITSKPQHSNSDIGSNLAILRLKKDDIVTMETNTNPFYVAISVYLMYQINIFCCSIQKFMYFLCDISI